MAGFLLGISIRSTHRGPIFDSRSTRAFADMRDELEEEAAEWTLDHIKDTYHQRFKHPTGYYESNVRVRNTGAAHEVWDGGWAGPVYGPWLEGVGSRNATTRFKGYRAFQKAARALDHHIDNIGDGLFRLRYRSRLE